MISAPPGTSGPCKTDANGFVPDSEKCAGPIAPAGNAPDITQYNAATSTSTPFSVPFLNPVTAGDGVVAVFYCWGWPGDNCGGKGYPLGTVTDSQGNTYSSQSNANCPMGFGGAQVYWSTFSLSGPDTVSFAGGNSPNAAEILEVPNLGAYEGCAGNNIQANTVSVTGALAHNGDIALGLSSAIGGPTFLYQDSQNWLSLIGTAWGDQQFLYSAYQTQGPIADPPGLTLEYSAAGWSSCLNCQTEAAMFVFQPAVWPPPGSGPPSFRYEVVTDPPLVPAIEETLVCKANSASGTAYTCNTNPIDLQIPQMIIFQPDIANTGTSATLAVNGSIAEPISLQAGTTTTLAAGDIAAAPAEYLMLNDGTTWELSTSVSTAPPVSGTQVSVNSGPVLSTMNLNSSTPTPDSGYTAARIKSTGGNTIVEVQGAGTANPGTALLGPDPGTGASVVQQVRFTGTATASSWQIVLPGVASGDSEVVFFDDYIQSSNCGAATISGNLSGTWTTNYYVHSQHVSIFYKLSSPGGTDTITVTSSVGSCNEGVLMAFELTPVTGFDGTNPIVTNNSDGTWSAPLTTTATYDVIFAVIQSGQYVGTQVLDSVAWNTIQAPLQTGDNTLASLYELPVSAIGTYSITETTGNTGGYGTDSIMFAFTTSGGAPATATMRVPDPTVLLYWGLEPILYSHSDLAQTGAIGATTMYAPLSNAVFDFKGTIGCTNNTRNTGTPSLDVSFDAKGGTLITYSVTIVSTLNPTLNLTYTDADNGVVQTETVSDTCTSSVSFNSHQTLSRLQ